MPSMHHFASLSSNKVIILAFSGSIESAVWVNFNKKHTSRTWHFGRRKWSIYIVFFFHALTKYAILVVSSHQIFHHIAHKYWLHELCEHAF